MNVVSGLFSPSLFQKSEFFFLFNYELCIHIKTSVLIQLINRWRKTYYNEFLTRKCVCGLAKVTLVFNLKRSFFNSFASRLVG